MQKFVADSPNAKVIGQALLALKESINFEEFADIMSRHGLNDIQPEKWYPYQVLLDFHKSLHDGPNGSENLVSIGVKVIETALLPDGVDSVSSALNLLNTLHQLNLRDSGREGYEITALDYNKYEVIDHTALPHDLIYGFLYGILRRFAPNSTKRVLKRTYLNPTNPNADSARYEIEW